MPGKIIGYVRVSTFDQNPDRQLQGIDLDKKFVDYASAKSTKRPQLQNMLDFIREDDVVVVHSMDRLARNLFDLRNLVQTMVSNKIEVRFVKENLSFSGKDSAMSNLLLNIMGSFAEFEYAFIKERQQEGIREAKKKGKFLGREKKLKTDDIEKLKELMKTRKSKSEISFELGICRQTLYKYLKILGINEE